jgi:hypothetical protein
MRARGQSVKHGTELVSPTRINDVVLGQAALQHGDKLVLCRPATSGAGWGRTISPSYRQGQAALPAV